MIPAGVQFPIRIQKAMASNPIIRTFNEKINMKIEKQTAQEAMTKSGSLITSASASINNISNSLKNVKYATDNVGTFGRN